MKKFKEWLNESLAKKSQFDDAMQAVMALSYRGMDVEKASGKEIADALISMGKEPPPDTSFELFVARIKAAAKGTAVTPDDFQKNPYR